MALSESRKRANEKWDEAHLEGMYMSVPKGTKALWKQYAAVTGLSLTKFVQQCVEEKVARDNLTIPS